MKKVSHRKNLRKYQKDKGKIHILKGGKKIFLPRSYSFSQKGDTINLFCDGEKIHDFWEGVTVQIIEKYISSYKVLKNYCQASVSTCHEFENCNGCNSLHKKWAERRKEKGEKAVRPKPEDISEERTTLSPIRSKKMSFERSHSWKW